jgi:hypothetical protein
VHVAPEDLAVEAEGDHALLDARPTRVVEAHDGAPDLHREVHDLRDLLAEDLTQRPAEDGEVLGEHGDGAAVDGAVPGDDAVAVGAVAVLAERDRAVSGVLVHLDERPLVEQQLEPFAGRLLAAGVLLLDGALGSGTRDLGHAALEVGEFSGGRRGVDVLRDVGTADGFGVAGGHGPSLALGA